MRKHSRAAVTAVTLCVAVACAGGGAVPEVEPMPARPLAGLVAQPMVVFPVHYLRTGDSIGWTATLESSRAYLAAFDSALERVFKDRGVAATWRFAPDLARSAQRNPGYLADPYRLAAQTLRPPAAPRNGEITDPLISQLRAWMAMVDSRVVFLPVEMRFEGRRDSAHAVLRVAIIDPRLARISWMADVKSDHAATPNREILESLARHVADLAVPP